MMESRRSFLKSAAALAGAAAVPFPARAEESYQLGCQTLPYRGQSLARAVEGIRKAGYKYVMPYYVHQGKKVFTPENSAGELAEVRRLFSDNGLSPFCRFAGLTAGPAVQEGLDMYLKELDLCADFGIRTVVGIGPWYYDKFPNVPKRDREWQKEISAFYSGMEKIVRHAESIGLTITMKPHTGITANARACMEVVKRLPSKHLKICWDAGNVSFYEGIYPDPDLPDLAPEVKAVCIKDHKGLRGEANFPTPGTGQIDHDQMFGILCGAGFRGPVAVERADGTEDAEKMPPEVIDERMSAARKFLVPILDKYTH